MFPKLFRWWRRAKLRMIGGSEILRPSGELRLMATSSQEKRNTFNKDHLTTDVMRLLSEEAP